MMASQADNSDIPLSLPGESSGSSSSNGFPVSNSTAATEAATSLAASLATNDAKSLLSSLLGVGSQISQAANLQMLSMAAANSSQRLPSLKPTTSLSPAPVPVTTPTRVTPVPVRNKRGRPPASDHEDSVKRKKGPHSASKATSEKQNKGLRHFSQLVCEKVREKGITTYNEVADELVKELSEAERKAGQDVQIDQKNIRRRVYDALNVLMAMNIINKEKKEIQWVGLPTNSVQECEHIQMELSQQEERIAKKTTELHELVLQILTLKNLIRRNREKAEAGESPTQHSAIGLPFILVNTNKQTTIDCSISSDKSEYVFTFDSTFELHQDADVLNKMGLDCGLYSGKCNASSLAEAKATLPKIFEPVLDEMALLSRTAPQSPPAPEVPPNTVTSTPTSQLHPTAPPTLLTPLLSEHSNGTSSSFSNNSPLAIAAAALAHNPASVAAAITTLQQLQQQQQQQTSSNAPPTSSPSSSPHSFRGGTVTARPLNFVSSPRPSLIANQPVVGNGQGAAATQSPKVVTVQPLSNTVSSRMAEVIASLRSSIFMQQQQLGVGAAPQCENSLPSGASPAELLGNKVKAEPQSPLAMQLGEVDQIAASFLTPSNPPVSFQ